MKKFFLPVLVLCGTGLALVWADSLPPVKVEGHMSAATITMPTPATTPKVHHHQKKWNASGFGWTRPASFGPTPTPTPGLTPTPTTVFEGGQTHINY